MKLFLPRQAPAAAAAAAAAASSSSSSSSSSHLVRRPAARFLTAMSSPTSRTYADALGLLDTLIPNTKVHALFGKPQTAVPGGSPQQQQRQPASDPNLLAIPEMRAWLLRANLTPQRLSALSCIHIAGTKGKGSVAALTTSALLAAAARSASGPDHPGHPGRVGTYTSPHLVTPRERIAIDGRPVSQPLFAAAFFELWDALSACPADRDGDDDDVLGVPAGAKPFYFRFLTLLAFHIFLREGVRSVVLECGIGGEYDATNAVVAAGDGEGRGGGAAAVTAAVITQLGVDHVAMLGDTPEAIAWHKAGVMKPGVPAFTRRLDAPPGPAVMQVLRARARDARARLVEVPDDAVDAWPGASSSSSSAKLPGGAFQKRNQALAALAAAHHLRQQQQAVAEEDARGLLRDVPEAVVAGLREATLRGRHEVLERGDVSWHLDGAHNADSLAEAARWAAAVVFVGDTTAAAAAAAAVTASATTTKSVLVFNQQERDASALLLGLLREMEAAGVDVASRLDAAIFTRNDKTGGGGGGAGDVTVQERCAAAFREAYPGVEALVCRDLTEMKGAVDAVAQDARVRVRVLVTGSMYLVGNVIGLLEPDGLL
ncbi:FolC bifunctional protein [Colletotrichum caudatum]|nr:FolC bifunctional protein [Colletotrichum caudatum]